MPRSYKPGGIEQRFGPDGMVEHETYTCAHCQRIITVPHKARAEDTGGLCYCCMRLICPTCVGKGCRPIEKWLEQEEAKDRFRRELEG